MGLTRGVRGGRDKVGDVLVKVKKKGGRGGGGGGGGLKICRK